MIEMVIALIMHLNGDIVEHTYKKNLSSCLASKGLQREK